MILLIHLKCKIKIFHSHPLMFLITVTFFNTVYVLQVRILSILAVCVGRYIFQVIYGFLVITFVMCVILN